MFTMFIVVGLFLGSAAMMRRTVEFEDFFGRYD